MLCAPLIPVMVLVQGDALVEAVGLFAGSPNTCTQKTGNEIVQHGYSLIVDEESARLLSVGVENHVVKQVK